MFSHIKELFTRPSGYTIARSVRLRSSASAYFNRTLTTPTSAKAWTFSAWVKRGKLGSAQSIFISTLGGAGVPQASSYFTSSDTIQIYDYTGSAYTFDLTTTQVFRDPSSWYHLIFVYDSANATSSSRVRLYVNGVQITAFSSASYPTQNADCAGFNRAYTHYLSQANAQYLDGYLTEINFIDGQALTPSSFGETDSITGVWKAKKYSGTYGTNGFYLNFSDNSSNTATTIGKDYSGNGNNWTPNNISVTAGVTYDSMVDSPTVGSLSSNYCVWNPLYSNGGNGTTISDGNLQTTTASTGTYGKTTGTFGMTTGKWYWEVLVVAVGSGANVGLSDLSPPSGSFGLGGYAGEVSYTSSGNKYINAVSTSYGSSYTTNDLIGVAFDADAGSVTFYKNNTSQGAITGLSGTKFAAVGSSGGTNPQYQANFGQRPFTYTPPTGFVALNTYNLPASTITNGAAYMAATVYSGNSPSSQTVSNAVNGFSFQPDLVWQKSRTQTYSNVLYDSVRGVQKRLSSNETAAESTASTAVTAFTSSGFTTGADGEMNDPTGGSNNHVAWQWKAGGTSASNTNGSITSTVSVGATQGFSVVTYSGGATGTVGHGLGVTPSMIIVKNRTGTADNWYVWHGTFTATEGIDLNLTDAKATGIQWWNSTLPTSSVFSVKTGGYGTANSGSTYVAYCFSAVAGYSAFGSYTANASADGPFIYTGFRPRWIMLKRSSAAGAPWSMFDTSRNTYNSTNLELDANASSAESTSGNGMDILSNGFKLRDSAYLNSSSGDTFIYAAFAENPFKLSLAR